VKRLDSEQKKAFDRAEKAWATFRKRWCDFRCSGVEGGSVYGLVYAACYSGLTEEHMKELQYLDACEEGDMSCPAPKRLP
jgi:uncharacterized protein YecT (DUF1311 family)